MQSIKRNKPRDNSILLSVQRLRVFPDDASNDNMNMYIYIYRNELLCNWTERHTVIFFKSVGQIPFSSQILKKPRPQRRNIQRTNLHKHEKTHSSFYQNS